MKSELTQLKNIGTTLAKRLNEAGIFTHADLTSIGAVEARKRIQSLYPNERLPFCYYLYSLQGAIMDMDWRDLPQSMKDELQSQV